MVTQNQKPTKNVYTLKEASDFLGISPRSVERLIARGLLRKSKSLRRVMLPGADVESLVERTC
jgi:excisionase family DNA binding protein